MHIPTDRARLVLVAMALSVLVLDGAASKAAPPPAVSFGLRGWDADSSLARHLGIRAEQGALVTEVLPDSPAAAGGLKPGDVIVSFGRVLTPRYDDLAGLMRQATIGSRYRASVRRGNHHFEITLVAAQRVDDPAGYPPTYDLGLFAISAGEPLARRLGIESPLGTAITAVRQGGPAAQAGLRRGDLIVELAGRPTDTFEDFQAIAFSCPLRSRQSIVVVRGVQRLEATIVIGVQTGYAIHRYYHHPQQDYRFRLLPDWCSFASAAPSGGSYDRIISPYAGYELRCYRESTVATDPAAALRQFEVQELRQSGAQTIGRMTLGGCSAVWGTMRQPQEPYLIYMLALLGGGKLHRIDVLAPVLSDPARLPHPIAMTLGTIELASRDVPVVESTAAAPKPAPEPLASPSPSASSAQPDERRYEHPQTLIRLPIPHGWSLLQSHRRSSPDPQYDSLLAPNHHDAILCWRESEAATDPLGALVAFEQRTRGELAEQAEVSDISTSGITIQGVPTLWLSYLHNQRSITRVAAVTRSRLVHVQVESAQRSKEAGARIASSLLARLEFPDSSTPLAIETPTAPSGRAPSDRIPSGRAPSKIPAGWQATTVGNVTVHLPPRWNASPLAAEDEGLWFLGDDLLRPDVAFQLVRDTPLESLLRGGAVRQQSEVTIGEVAATQYLVDIEGLEFAETGLIVVLSPTSGAETIAFTALAAPEHWPTHEPVVRQVFEHLQIDSVASNAPAP